MKKVPLTVFEIYLKGARPLCKSPHTTSTCVFPITWGNVVRRLMQTAEMSKTMRMRGMMRCEQIFFSRLEKNTFFSLDMVSFSDVFDSLNKILME